jgi:hypothetical protein
MLMYWPTTLLLIYIDKAIIITHRKTDSYY